MRRGRQQNQTRMRCWGMLSGSHAKGWIQSAFIAVVLFMTGMNQVLAAEYQWPAYSPNVAYDFNAQFGHLDAPTQVLDDVTGVVGTYTDRWWCFRWGANKNSEVTSADWVPMLERLNTDFAYITDVMGWPRDKRSQRGYYSTVYLYGSGLSTDSASNTDTGGWMGSTTYMGESWPMILASYYPVHCFDPAYTDTDKGYQTGAMVHEGIHAVLANMPGCYNSAWTHESSDTWLQGTMEAQRNGDFSGMGWLSCGSMLAPFMPIECYSGWLLDGSFGGPSAEGVNVFQGTQQICTWRNLLGGVQYSEAFPHALEVILGPKSMPWIWNNAHYSGRVLQDLAEAPDGLGDAQTRRLIQEYRARQAFCDFKQWSYAYEQLLNNNWNVSIQEEWTPCTVTVDPWIATCYVATTNSGGVLTPDALTLPGWSGANQIPLTVNPSATSATVTFNPIGANMSCQLVYRDTSGAVHYSDPVSSGVCTLPLGNVMNNVIVAVVCNTDYTYVDDSTRTAKFDYTLTLGSGITGQADINTQWYRYDPSSYTITASADAHGTVSPSGTIVVNAGGSQSFTFTPDAGYEVNKVLLNGRTIGPMTSYTLNPVRGNHTIEVNFAPAGPPAAPTGLGVTAAAGRLSLDWADNTDSDFAYYTVYRSTSSGGNYAVVASGLTSSDYRDYSVVSGVTYYYVVTATDELVHESAYSAEASATAANYVTTPVDLPNGDFEQCTADIFNGISSANGGFDDPAYDVPGWMNFGTPADSGEQGGGAWWGTYNNTYSGFMAPGDGAYIMSSHTIQAGDLFTIGFVGKSWDGSSQWTATLFYDNPANELGTYVQSVDGTWTPYNGTTAIPATAASVGGTLGISFVNTGSGYANLDDVTLSLISSDPSDTTPPAAPSGLVATAGNGSVALDWADNTEPDLSSYTVYRSTTSGSGYSAIASGLGNSAYTDNTVASGTTYYYVVTATDTSANESGISAEVSATPQQNPPTTPTVVSASVVSDTQIDLSWGGSTGADSYNVKRAGTSGGPYTTIANPVGTSYSDTGLTASTTYYYVISAVNGAGESADSSQISATTQATPDTTPPEAPTGLGATAGDGSVALDWTDNTEPDLASYTVYRSTTSGSGYAVIASGLAVSAYTDNSVANGKTYYYVVTATDASSNESADSAEVSATPIATSDVVLYLPFDETSGTTATDLGPNGFDGTLVNGPLWATGLFTNSVLLDGVDDYVSLPSGVVGNLGDCTISTWINLSSASMWSRIFDFGSGTMTNMFLTPQGGAGVVRFAITTTGNAAEQQIDGTAPLPTNAWTHVAVTMSGGTGILYVNGVAVGTNSAMTLTPAAMGNTTQNYIGKSQYPDPSLDGAVDDFRIFGRALSASEIATLATPPAAAQQYMHVASIALSTTGGRNTYGVATVTIVDASGQPVSGMTVTGDFTGSYNETDSAVTDGAGVAVIQTSSRKRNPSFTFTVTSVTGSGYTYDPASNVVSTASY